MILNKNTRQNFKIVLFDTAGQERYRAITKSYFRDSQGIVLISYMKIINLCLD